MCVDNGLRCQILRRGAIIGSSPYEAGTESNRDSECGDCVTGRANATNATVFVGLSPANRSIADDGWPTANGTTGQFLVSV